MGIPTMFSGKQDFSVPTRSKVCPNCGIPIHSFNITIDTNKKYIKNCPYCSRVLGEVKPYRKSEEKLLKPDEKSWGIGLFDNKLKPVLFTKDGRYQFEDDKTWLHNIIYIASKETFNLYEAKEELEYLINQDNIKEAALQDFFERNPVFILGDDYKKAYPHIALVKCDGTLIPDFILEPVGQNELCDLLDLKLPSEKIFVTQKNRERYSAAVREVCAQLREYSSYFEQESNRDLIYKTYGLLAYMPRMMVVIGRRSHIDPILARRIESETPRLILKTYDDLLERANAKLHR